MLRIYIDIWGEGLMGKGQESQFLELYLILILVLVNSQKITWVIIMSYYKHLLSSHKAVNASVLICTYSS